MSFTQFIKPYPDGYIDGEAGDTPVTAEILNTNYDGFLLALNEFLPELEGMVEANPSEAATAGNLTKLKVGNSIYLIPSGGSGGSTVEWEQLQITGTKIATITIDNVPIDVYAPSGGGSGDEVSWNQVLGSGTEIGTITINGTPITVYAPTPIDVEANPSGSATAGDLTKLKVGSSIYSIPSGGSGGSGHTILDDDGTALAQEDDLQFVGVYSEDDSTDEVTKVNIYREMTKSEFDLLSADEKKGFIRVTDEPDIVRIVDGVFIDTDNLILSGTLSNSGTTSYTATEDCYFIGYSSSGNALAYLVDNVTMIFAPTNQTHSLLLKKGQTLTIGEASTYSISYKIYGIQQGSNVVSSYSETILWSGTEVCNDANAHSLTLLDDYTNYDAIAILTTDSDNQKGISTFLVSALELNQGYVDVWYPASNAGAYFILTGTKAISVYRISYANTLTYNKIIGIRY